MLNILQVHGFPKVMGILTHMDLFDKAKHIKHAKKSLKKRFEEESFAGAKLFHLSGCLHGRFVIRSHPFFFALFAFCRKLNPITFIPPETKTRGIKGEGRGFLFCFAFFCCCVAVLWCIELGVKRLLYPTTTSTSTETSVIETGLTDPLNAFLFLHMLPL